jgi:hypothetical protein
MSDTKEYQELLLAAFEGERFGETFFATMAEAETDPDRVAKLRTLEEIEARTAAVLEPLMAAAGLPIGDGADSRKAGQELGEGAAAGGWDTFTKGLNDALPDFLASFVRCRELAPDPQDPALVALISHEQAISTFAQLECTGRGHLSHAPLQWYLEHAR